MKKFVTLVLIGLIAVGSICAKELRVYYDENASFMTDTDYEGKHYEYEALGPLIADIINVEYEAGYVVIEVKVIPSTETTIKNMTDKLKKYSYSYRDYSDGSTKLFFTMEDNDIIVMTVVPK